jgi:uncharacterized protein YfaS (alpha-2-macroglobulin family)
VPTPAAAPGGRPTVTIVDASLGALTANVGATGNISTNAPVTSLSQAETDALLARLEPLPAVDNSAAPTMRPASAPPRRVGSVTPIAFVRPTGKQVADSPISQAPAPIAPMEAPQILPSGEVRAESEVRIRFAQAMVPIARVGQPADVATITPAIAGTWSWVDTHVAKLTSTAKRFPAATQFTVRVKPGLKSLMGATLQDEITGTFATPPVMLTGIYPHSRVRPDSPLLLEFDQEIDPAAIAKRLRVEDARKHKLPFKTITLDAAKTLWAKNPSLEDEAHSSYRVIIVPQTQWPAGIDGRVVLAKNAPSREGPRVSSDETYEDFSVAPAFEAMGLSCRDMNRPSTTGANCPAWSYLQVQFTNPIDAKRYHAKLVQIEGQPLDDHTPYDDFVGLQAPHDVGKDHAVVIGPMFDVYGQSLVGAKRLPFKTTPEIFDPYLNGDTGLFVLDPRFTIPQWVLHAQAMTNLHVTLYQVEPRDYFAFEDYEQGKRTKPPGKQVFDQDFTLGKRYGGDARIDLRPALKNGSGHVIAIATGGKQKLTAWIEVTKLALSSRIDGEHVHTFVQDVSPAAFMKPITNATTTMLVDGRSDAAPPAATDGDGHAMFDLLAPDKDPRQPTALLLAVAGDDSVFAPIRRIEKTVRERDARWYVTDDRFTYKPGEPVYVKGWVRWIHNGINPRLELPAPSDTIAYSLTDSRGNKIASGTTKLSPQGGFDLTVQLPSNVNLGTASFTFETNRESHRHPISIEEFRTPAYAVNLNDDVSHAGATPLVLGESIDMTAEAKYYGGGGLAGSRIEWDATLTPATYRPAGWDRYTFMPPRKRSARGWRGYEGDLGGASSTETTTLSGASASSITYGITALPSGVPSILSVDVTVTDIDRQTIRASSRKIVVHPATRYVGLRLKPESDNEVQAIVTDIDGNPIAGVPIDVTLEGVLGSERWRNDAEVVDTQQCHVTSAIEPVTCTFKRKDWQYAYAATAVVADPRGRTNRTLYDLPWWQSRDQDFDAVADKELYKPGDVAKLTLHSKTLPATMFVTFARQGVIAQKRVELTTGDATVELPIDEAYVQNIAVLVDRIAKRDHQQQPLDPPLPEHEQIQVDLAVDVESQRLTMRTRPLQPLVEPGENATFEVEVKHADRPLAGAEVALVVVDEAILAVSGKSHADPLEPFYRSVDDGTWSLATHGMIRDAGNAITGKPGFDRYKLEPGQGTATGFGYGSGHGGMSGRSVSAPSVRMGVVQSRKDFRATAVFSPTLITDEHGKVKVTVKMPDSLTRFRIVALATAKTGYFGKAENNIVTQRKVNARTVAPRFLNQGDTFSLPVVVQNLDQTSRTIDVAVRAANLAGHELGKRVVVPGGQRAEVRFDFTTAARGKAVIQTIVQSGNFADASQVEVPVYEPATTESFATYGSIDTQPHFERLEVPADVFRDVGGVETELASTQLQELTDAYWYLYAYPFECAEQRSARMLATTAIYDILDAFATPGRPTKQEITEQRALDLQKLTRDQREDGGWGYFRGVKSDPYVTMQVLMAIGNEKGAATKKAIAYVTARYDELMRARDKASVALAAAALTALAATGLDVSVRAARVDELANKLHAYPIDAQARVLAILAGKPRYRAVRERLLASLLSSIHETASAANVAVAFTEAERLLLVSNTKSSALVLDALLREAPQQALVPKLARGILDARKRGRWISTQENLFVLQAMRRYFDNYEKDTPNYTGKLWLGTAAYTEQSFVGRNSARSIAELGWDQLHPGSAHDIVMQKTGPGRMYFRIGITYAPKQTNLPPLDAGFLVRREYQAVDDPSDVVKLADGSWQIKLGARVLVTIEEINTSPRHGVAVVDPMPAGFEAVNTRLATSEREVVDLNATRWDYTNMRDNRSEVFSMYLPEGSHRFSYTARATIPGRFLAAPAKAEEMYNPETFGRSGGAIVVVR